MPGRKRFCPLLLILILLLPLNACEEKPAASQKAEAVQAASAHRYTADDLAKLVLSVDREEIAIGTCEIITLSAEGFAEDGTVIPDLDLTYYAEGKKLDYPYFCAAEKGYYNLFAKYGDLRSNVIEVRAHSPEVQSVELSLSSVNILPGEKVTFDIASYTAVGKGDKSRNSVHVNGKPSMVTSQEFTEKGIYTVYASNGNADSAVQVFAVVDEVRYAMSLTADRETASPGETVNLQAAVSSLADGSSVPADQWKICLADGGETGESYTVGELGFCSFYIDCGGEVSETVTVEVRDPETVLPEGAFDGVSSSLPVIVLDAGGKSINPYRPRPCKVSVYGSPGKGAQHGDLPTLVTDAEIKQRGQSSMGFEKKQYSLHTINEDGSNNNVRLLGLPKENDWVLNGSYADKSLIRNALAQRMLSEVMDYTSRTEYCEVYLRKDDGRLDYIGVYTLLETIKIDGKRVNIDKLTEDDNAEPEITGGYVFSLDKVKGGENTLDTQVGTLTVVKPGPDTITSRQDRYIKDYLKTFTDTIKTDKRDDPVKGVTAYVDIESFAGPLVITELLRNVDGFAISTYMYKERDGLIHYGPGWDYDLSLGNADYNDGRNAHEWYVVKNSSLIRNLMRADVFSACVVKTWKELRKDLLSDENLDRFLDEELAKVGGDCITRSCARWPNHWNGAYVWPNYNYGDYFTKTHAEEIDMMRTFIHERAKWMDKHIDELLDYPF